LFRASSGKGLPQKFHTVISHLIARLFHVLPDASRMGNSWHIECDGFQGDVAIVFYVFNATAMDFQSK